jgi:hypothetical protein
MTATVPSLLQPLKDRLTAATPGPWDRHDAQIRHTQIDGWVDPEGRKAAQEQTERDIRFVMNAPTDQAKLIAAIEAVAALHEPGPGYLTTDVACQACSNSIGYVLYPCNTVHALTQALGGDTA